MKGEAKYLEALARCVSASAPNPGLAARVLEALLSRGSGLRQRPGI